MKYMLIMSLFLCVACEKKEKSTGERLATEIDQNSSEDNLVRYQDKDNGVLCYRVRGYNGVSCVIKEQK